MLFGVCMILSCMSSSFAQDIKLGATGFLGVTNWTKEYNDAKSRAVLGLGASGQYTLTDKLSLGAELIFSSIGPKIDDPEDDFFGHFSIKTIQIPLFASYNVVDKLHVQAGFQPALILSVNAIIDNEPNEGKYDLSEDYRSMNMDFILGTAYDITDNITGFLHINQGLIDVETDRETRDFRSTGMQLGVRYWLFNN